MNRIGKGITDIKDLIGTLNKTLPSIKARREKLECEAKVLLELEGAMSELSGKLKDKIAILLETNDETKDHNKQIQ